MRTQALLLTVPSVAMAVVGFAMFGPGAVQPFDGARIRGGPFEGLSAVSWRITVLQRYRSIDSTRDIGQIVVSARDRAGHEARAYGSTGRDGTCDVSLDFRATVTPPLHAIVTLEATGATLAEGDLVHNAAGWGESPGHPVLLTGSTSGDFAVEVRARRGIFAAPFRDELTVVARENGAPLGGAKVTLRTEGADLDGGAIGDSTTSARVVITSERGEATFGVTPRMHAVDADIDVAIEARGAAWHGLLPVVPGAIWLDPDRLATAATIRVVAPVPREFVYATLANATTRLWGGLIPLTTDSRGFAVGEIDWPIERPRSVHGPAPLVGASAWLTLASDPLASGAGTVGWPVRDDGSDGERPFRDQLLIDGMPAAERRDQDRRYRARSLSAVALGAAAVLEGVLLARDSAARTLRAWAWTAIAIATVALAFAAIGVVVMWKTSG
jgi:hypothetical protein